MFIYTVKASKLKFFALLICAVAVLLTLAAVIPKTENNGEVAVVSYNYGGIANNADRVSFLKGFGYEVETTPLEVVKVTIPDRFDSVYEKYNDIQRAQGLNLKRFRGRTVTRYTYKVTNIGGAGGADVLANILVYRKNVIGGDVCSLGTDGFIHGFEMPAEPPSEQSSGHSA